MLTPERLRDLARLSLTDPARGGHEVMALNPGLSARWVALAAGVTLGVLVAYLLPLVAGRLDEVLPPFTAVGVQLGINLLAVLVMTRVGRMFGGAGRFEDALLLVAWLQWLMIAIQAVQFLVLLVLPPLGGLVTIFAVAAFFWLLSGFVQALHGFASRGVVLIGVLGTMFLMAMLISLILMMVGFDPRLMTDV